MATLLASTAISLPNDAYALFDPTKATKIEQLTQIKQANQQLKYMLQMLQHVKIGDQIKTIFNQMTDMNIIVEEVMSYEVPTKFTQDYDILTDKEYATLRDEREAYYEDIISQISDLESEIALNDNQLDTLSMASSIALAPPSDITAQQATFVGDAARLEQQRRQAALEILRNKKEDIKEQLTIGDKKALEAALKCIRTCR